MIWRIEYCRDNDWNFILEDIVVFKCFFLNFSYVYEIENYKKGWKFYILSIDYDCEGYNVREMLFCFVGKVIKI